MSTEEYLEKIVDQYVSKVSSALRGAKEHMLEECKNEAAARSTNQLPPVEVPYHVKRTSRYLSEQWIWVKHGDKNSICAISNYGNLYWHDVKIGKIVTTKYKRLLHPAQLKIIIGVTEEVFSNIVNIFDHVDPKDRWRIESVRKIPKYMLSGIMRLYEDTYSRSEEIKLREAELDAAQKTFDDKFAEERSRLQAEYDEKTKLLDGKLSELSKLEANLNAREAALREYHAAVFQGLLGQN